MIRRLRFVKRLIRELPGQVKLTYCLLFDPRVPAHLKGGVAAAMAIIVTPFIDLPALIPFLGELDVLALTLLSLRLFINACPEDVVADQQQLINERRSRFDEDVRSGEHVASAIATRLRPLMHRFNKQEGGGS